LFHVSHAENYGTKYNAPISVCTFHQVSAAKSSGLSVWSQNYQNKLPGKSADQHLPVQQSTETAACELLDKRVSLRYHFLGCQEYIYWKLFPLSGSDNTSFPPQTAG
jgi:hypothetical protein